MDIGGGDEEVEPFLSGGREGVCGDVDIRFQHTRQRGNRADTSVIVGSSDSFGNAAYGFGISG